MWPNAMGASSLSVPSAKEYLKVPAGSHNLDSDVISVVANRYTPGEIESALWFLFGCFLICLVAFCVASWIRAQDNTYWSVLVKPVIYNKKGRTEVRDCRTFDPYRTKRKKRSWWKRLWKKATGQS